MSSLNASSFAGRTSALAPSCVGGKLLGDRAPEALALRRTLCRLLRRRTPSRPARHPARALRSRSRCACRAPVSARIPAARSPSSHPLGPCVWLAGKASGNIRIPPGRPRIAGDPLWQPVPASSAAPTHARRPGRAPERRRGLVGRRARLRRGRVFFAAWPRSPASSSRPRTWSSSRASPSSARARSTRLSSASRRSSSSATRLDEPLDAILRLLRALERLLGEVAGRELRERLLAERGELRDHRLLVHRRLLYPFDAITIRVSPAARIASSDRDRRAPRPGRLLRRRGGAGAPRAARAPARRRRRPARPRRGRDRQLRGAAVRHLLGDVVRRGAAPLPARDVRRGRGTRSTASTRSEVWSLVREVVPTVEQAGIDEGYLDLGEIAPAFDDARALAESVQAVIRARTQLSCSLGLASSKVVAKIASDRRKPGGLTIVRPGPRGRVPGAARDPPAAGDRPARRGAAASPPAIETIGDLAALGDDELRALHAGQGRPHGARPRPRHRPAAARGLGRAHLDLVRGDLPAGRRRPRAAARRADAHGRAARRLPARPRPDRRARSRRSSAIPTSRSAPARRRCRPAPTTPRASASSRARCSTARSATGRARCGSSASASPGLAEHAQLELSLTGAR